MSDSTPQVVLVDITGRPIVADDQGNAATWPQSNLADGWHWEVSEDERAALEAAEVERLTDLHDAPPDPWPTAEEMAEYDRWQEQAEASRDFYRRNGSFGDWIAREGGPRP
jgi:hypothetical protein